VPDAFEDILQRKEAMAQSLAYALTRGGMPQNDAPDKIAVESIALFNSLFKNGIQYVLRHWHKTAISKTGNVVSAPTATGKDGSTHALDVADRTLVQQHLSQMCGYNPTKKYKSTRDLPKRSKLGWSIDWSDERYALEMLQCPYNVALSVEVAVQKETDSNAGKSKRNAGLAAALKDNVYRSIDLPWVLTRHFQIMEVNIPGSGRKKQEISGANNVGSDTFIRMLGGREIGSAYERSTIKAHDANGTEHDVELLIRWIFCLAPRKTSLEVIEGRANRM
jgi:hypothetical protein